MSNYKNRLKDYIRTDVVYQDFMEHPTKKFNDFDMFCVEHCEDIKKLLEENDKLEKELKELRGKND